MFIRKLGAWLGWDDRIGAGVLAGSLLFIFLLLGVLPRWLHRQEVGDYQGVPEQTAPGFVSTVTISPTSQGGGGLFNGINVTFAGRQAYYALPRTSRWDPVYGQAVTVRYQVGRQSGIVRVDQVTPDKP